jgi:small subunit ribosomal protein S17
MTKAEITKKVRTLQGTIVSAKMDKTRIVAVESMKKHPKYLRYYKVTRRFAAHDEANVYKEGDKVTVRECRPLSRTKRWEVVGKIS